jgi:hypothetical protein
LHGVITLPILSATDVERCFIKLGLPYRFSVVEKERLKTIDVVNNPEKLFGFPTPESASINILNLRQILGIDPAQPPCFFDHPWYLNEPFAKTPCGPGWHFLWMDVLRDSLGWPVNYVGRLETSGWTLPSAVEVTLMIFLHFAGTGEQLLQRKHTWCSDSDSLGRFVTVGAFGRKGLFVSAHPPVFVSRGLGICGKRKPMPPGSCGSPANE